MIADVVAYLKARNNDLWLATVSLICLFLFFRFYHIATTMLFQNDMGRDLLVLYDWHLSGKPPLLGPQSGALPINQSAIYFYFLYPFYLLSRMSFFSALYANACLYIGGFLISFWLAKDRWLRIVVLLVFFLVTIHPQVIAQNRFVWNPSFVPPFLLVALVTLARLIERWQTSLLIIHAFAIAIAVSLHFSIGPLYLAVILTMAVFKPRRLSGYLCWTVIAVICCNLPTLFFELRHHFLLTKSLLHGAAVGQVRTSFANKLYDFITFTIAANKSAVNSAVAGFVLLTMLTAMYLLVRRWTQLSCDNRRLRFFLVIGFLTLLITFIAPVRIEKHYIFGILMITFFVIGLLPNWIRLAIVSLFVILWLNPAIVAGYFLPSPRTPAQLDACFAQICAIEMQPMFESLQSGLLTFHAGPEYQYLMKRNGCILKQISQDPSAASQMAVVVDQSSFDIKRTSYLELSQFGPAQDIRTYTCGHGVSVHILEKRK